MEQPETLRQQIADQLVKLIESHNELLLFTASSCADSFREYEAREVLDWADGKNERGNSINTDFAKEMVDAVFVRVDPEELADDDCGHDSMDGDGHGNWVCMCCKNTYSDHKDSAGFTYMELVREGHEHDFCWTFKHCRYCDKKIDVRVDPEELKTQLREELEQFYQLRCGWANGAGEDSDDEKWTDDTVDRVISLFFPVVNQETSDE